MYYLVSSTFIDRLPENYINLPGNILPCKYIWTLEDFFYLHVKVLLAELRLQEIEESDHESTV